MRNVGLIFGAVGGALLSGLLLLSMVLWQNGTINFDTGEVFGYSGMVIALSVIFFGIKSYRDNYLKGTLKFVKGLQVGLLVTAIASILYAVTWEVYRLAAPDEYARFVQEYTQCQIDKAREAGASQEELDAKAKQLADYQVMYENPALRFGVTILEVFPVGILVTLLSAALLRRKEVLPA
jgi:hypothetical protein